MINAAVRKLGRWGGGDSSPPLYSVDEHHDDDDDASEDLADFGFAPDHRGFCEPLLAGGGGEEHVDVDELMNNPMAESTSIFAPSRKRKLPRHTRSDVSDNNNNMIDDFNIIYNDDNVDKGFGFVLLRRLRLLPKHDGYAYVSDLDAFFTALYNYYYNRGLGSIIGKGAVEILSLFFTLWLSLILFAYIDWTELQSCHDEYTCKDDFLTAYIIHDPFLTWKGGGHLLRNAWIVIYCLLFTVYGIFCVIQYFQSILASLECKVFMEEVLGVSDRDLEVGGVEWGDIVERMSEAQRVGKCRVAILPGSTGVNGLAGPEGEVMDGPTSHLVIAQRIMRRENYMIAFINRGLLDLTLPHMPPRLGKVSLWPLTLLTNRPKEEAPIFFSKSIEWSIYFCVLNYMFNHSRKVRPAFYADPSSLRRRFMLCGIAHAVFMPFLLFFVTLHFFMSNVYDWQSTKEYLGPREWSSLARWTFREFNEYPHSFERRMEPSYKSAASYLDLFNRPKAVKVAVARLLVFLSGSVGALMLVFATMNDAILLHVRIGDRNLLWYAGMLGTCFSVGRSMLPKVTNPHYGHARRNLIVDMNLELEKLATYTHFLPDTWRKRAAITRTKNEVASMFKYKASHFAHEFLSIVFAPIILCVSLPRCAENICTFVRDTKVEVTSIGDVVGYSTFDFDSFEDENWTDKSTDHSVRQSERENVERLIFKVNDRPKTLHGKMEKSFFNFKGMNPNWKMPLSGFNLVAKIDSFRQKQDAARERRLHIEAAAAQFETLRRLEIERERRASAGLTGHLDERRIRSASASSGPDSGGGPLIANLTNYSDDASSDDDSLGSLPNAVFHNQQEFIEESVNSFAPPPSAFSHSTSNYAVRASSPYYVANNSSQGRGSVMHYTDAGLSMELKGLLNTSTLYDPTASHLSFTGSLVPMDDGSFLQHSLTGSLVPMDDQSASILKVRSDQQYSLLDRYHSQMAHDRQGHGMQTERR